MSIIIAALIIIIGCLIVYIIRAQQKLQKLDAQWGNEMCKTKEEVYPCFLVLRKCPAEEYFRQEIDFSLYDTKGIIGYTIYSSEIEEEQRSTFPRAVVYSILDIWMYKIDYSIGGADYERIEDDDCVDW